MDTKKLDRLKKSKPFRVFDFAILAVVVLVIVLSYVLLFKQSGVTVDIWVHGKKSSYSLNTDAVLLVGDEGVVYKKSADLTKSKGHSYHLEVVIRDGKVWVSEADCPDQICVKSGKIAKAHRTIACIPNNISISITDEKSDLDVIV